VKYCRLFIMILCILIPGFVVLAAPEPFTDELDTNLYNCALTLKAGAHLAAGAMVRLGLETVGEKEGVRLSIAPRIIYIATVHDGAQQVLNQVKIDVKPGTAVHLTIQRRGDELGILHEDTCIFRGKVPHAPGATGVVTADEGWTVDDVHVQRLEPVAFADDFMRTKEDNGAWTVQTGRWHLASAWDKDPHGNENRFNMALYAQNPFSWVGMAEKGAAICTTGKPIWEDYTFSVAICPSADGAVGALVNMTDTNTGLLIRWSAANDRSPRGNRLSVERYIAGKTVQLQADQGGFIPGQWYKLTVVSSLGDLRVLIDNRERITLTGVTPWHGSVALYTESHDGTTFNNVSVYGRTVKTDLIKETGHVRIQEKFLQDWQGMRTWASPSDWSPTDDGVNIAQHEYYGDQWMVATVRPTFGAGKLVMVLHGNGENDAAGLRAVITEDTENRLMIFHLLHDNIELATKSGPLFDTAADTTVRFRYAASKLTLEVDGKSVVEATDTRPTAGDRPAYRADGAFHNTRDVLVLGPNYLDYTFTESPVDWIGEGTWMPTVRWACQPQWSFYSGWSRGDAVLWYKNRFSGDQSMQVYMGYKMETPREREIYESIYHYHDACISICTDGINPRSGYAVMSGQHDEFNRPSAETVLLRNGVPVQRVNVSVFGWGMAHHAWFDLELRKHGDLVEFWLDGALAMSYRDPHPLEGGVPAIWTSDGGISIARVRMSFANPPQPRTEPQVTLDTPWYPEWANVGQPLTLRFPGAWSTTGKPVSLHVNSRLIPAGATLPAVKENQIVLTPNKVGEFWYQVTAGDGKYSSPAFNLSGQAFDPSLGRDDSHAVVLYRFNEGTGAVVHDRSAIGDPADLQVPAYPNTNWLPGQGLTFSGPMPLKTAAAVSKLMSVAKNKACTVEIWASNDTSYFPQHWLGCLLTWEKDINQRNLLFGGHKATMALAPFGARFDPLSYDNNSPNLEGAYNAYMAFRTSLHHMVVTWDGTTTRGYTDGKAYDVQQINWNVDKWVADAPLLLGNRTDGQRTYLGTYYLVAIHDRCLSEAEVKHNYQAGPSATWVKK